MGPLQGGGGNLTGATGTTLSSSAKGTTGANPAGAAINQVPIYTSGNVLGASTTTPSVSPAVAAAAAAAAKASADFNSLKGNIYGSIGEAITQGGQGYQGSLQDYLGTRQQTLNQINQDAVQNELAREQGMQGVTDMVGNGIRSGGITLANDNAGTSSAGDALARAYGLVGRQQASSVGNQAAQGQNKVNVEEQNLALADTTERRHAAEDKTSTINNIVSNARQQLGSLNQMAMYASIPDRVNIEAKISQVKQQALNDLSAFDKTLSGGIAKGIPESSAGIQASANQLLTAGVAPASAFDYTTDVPAVMQNTGPSPSSLPIYVAPSAKKTNQ